MPLSGSKHYWSMQPDHRRDGIIRGQRNLRWRKGLKQSDVGVRSSEDEKGKNKKGVQKPNCYRNCPVLRVEFTIGQITEYIEEAQFRPGAPVLVSSQQASWSAVMILVTFSWLRTCFLRLDLPQLSLYLFSLQVSSQPFFLSLLKQVFY